MGEYLIHAWLDFFIKLQKYTSFVYSRSTSEECKNLDAVLPNQLLVVRTDAVVYQMEEYKNLGLIVILYFLNSFQHNNHVAFLLLCVLLRKKHKINAVRFSWFHNGCNPACKVWRRLQRENYLISPNRLEKKKNKDMLFNPFFAKIRPYRHQVAEWHFFNHRCCLIHNE